MLAACNYIGQFVRIHLYYVWSVGNWGVKNDGPELVTRVTYAPDTSCTFHRVYVH